jgi:hypothetical protein
VLVVAQADASAIKTMPATENNRWNMKTFYSLFESQARLQHTRSAVICALTYSTSQRQATRRAEDFCSFAVAA